LSRQFLDDNDEKNRAVPRVEEALNLQQPDGKNDLNYSYGFGRILSSSSSILGTYLDPSTMIQKTENGENMDKLHLFICTQYPREDQWAQDDFGFKILRSIYPSLTLVPRYLTNVPEIKNSGATRDDIAISYMRGTTHSCNFSPDEFPGKLIVFSGEPHPPLVHGERVLFLGPDPDGPNSIRIPYAAMLTSKFDPSHSSRTFRKKAIFYHDQKPMNTKEMFLIYAAKNCMSHRDEAFDAIAARITTKEFHYAGACHGKTQLENKVDVSSTFPSHMGFDHNYWLYSKYMFALVMENSDVEGYISEKILNAYIGGSIPIWWGNTFIFNVFNKKSFIFFDVENPGPALDLISYLESNHTAYESMLDEPILADGALREYFSFSQDLEDGYLGKRIQQKLDCM